MPQLQALHRAHGDMDGTVSASVLLQNIWGAQKEN